MEWPSSDGAIQKNFGWNNEGQPVLGASFGSQGDVRAADYGELLFQNDGNGASRLPSPLGSWTALDHGGGIIGIYSRMGPMNRQIPDIVYASDVIGGSGISGWSNQAGFYFSLFDRKERRWINPEMIINQSPDPRPPVIQAVLLRDSEGRLFNLAQTGTISQGRYTIIAETAQIIQGQSLAPFRIICSINGIEAGGLNFETYSARDGVLMVYRNGLVPVRQVYAPYPAFELGSTGFTRGQITLDIIAQDAGGNSSNITRRFTVE